MDNFEKFCKDRFSWNLIPFCACKTLSEGYFSLIFETRHINCKSQALFNDEKCTQCYKQFNDLRLYYKMLKTFGIYKCFKHDLIIGANLGNFLNSLITSNPIKVYAL